MRTLHADLTTAQKSHSIKGLYKIVLTKSGEDTQTFEQDRIIGKNGLVVEEEEDRQSAEILLDNSDEALNSLDLEAYKGVISTGLTDANGVDRYAAKAPMWVIAQQFDSIPGKLVCQLSLAGVMSLMQSDRNASGYFPTVDDTNTVKDHLNALLDGSMPGFDTPIAYPAYTVVYDSEDDVIDDYMPKDSFSVKLNESRLSVYKKLLGLTNCRSRVENDGSDNAEIHIFVPTITGSSYDYEYKLNVSGEHTFWGKRHRDRIVIPNAVRVVWPEAGAGLLYGAISTASPHFANMPKGDFRIMRLKSNAEAATITSAILARAINDAQTGSGSVPINVGQEVWDYILITDSRENQNAVGNVAYLRTTCGEGRMTSFLSFGRVTLAGLSGTSLPQTTAGNISTNDLYNLIRQMWEIIENMLGFLEDFNIDAILNTVMTTWGDTLYRGVTEAQRLGPDAGGGYNFLQSDGEGFPTKWTDIEAIIQFMTGAVNRMIAASLAIPAPSIVLTTAADASGGGFTSDKSLSITAPTIAVIAAESWLLIDDCEDAWDEYVQANVTSTADNTDKQEGTYSAKMDVAAGASVGRLATEAFASKDLTSFKYLKAWVKSSVNLDASDISILLDEHAECVSPLEDISLPALNANIWTELTLTLSDPSVLGAIISIGVDMDVDKGAFVFRIDHVKVTGGV